EMTAVRELLDRLKLPGEMLTERLYRETEGLPFFLNEYLTLLRQDRNAVMDSNWSLPLGVQDLLRSRLAALSETARQLLSAASVIDRSFDVEALRECSGRSEEEVVDGLEELLRRGLIRDARAVPGGALSGAAGSIGYREDYEFYHEKLRALVY